VAAAHRELSDRQLEREEEEEEEELRSLFLSRNRIEKDAQPRGSFVEIGSNPSPLCRQVYIVNLLADTCEKKD
jgi:hypothetical protein